MSIMVQYLTQILNYLKLPTQLILSVVLASGIILFVPLCFLEQVGLAEIRQQYKSYLGAALILSGSIFLSRSLTRVATWTWEQYRSQVLRRGARKYLLTLTLEEAQILGDYLEQETKTLTLSVTSGVVAGLETAGIIYRPTRFAQESGLVLEADYNIFPWAWNYLHRHQEVLGLRREKER